jgi:hypothetical protein
MGGGSSSETSAWTGTWGTIPCCAVGHWVLGATRSLSLVSPSHSKAQMIRSPTSRNPAPALFPQTQGSRLSPPPSDPGIQTPASSLRPRDLGPSSPPSDPRILTPVLLSQTQGCRLQPSFLRDRSLSPQPFPLSDPGIWGHTLPLGPGSQPLPSSL